MDLLSWNLRNGAVFEGDNIEAVLCPGAGQNSMIKESKNKRGFTMKRRITSMLLAAAMTITMLTGCGSQGKETEKTD